MRGLPMLRSTRCCVQAPSLPWRSTDRPTSFSGRGGRGKPGPLKPAFTIPPREGSKKSHEELTLLVNSWKKSPKSSGPTKPAAQKQGLEELLGGIMKQGASGSTENEELNNDAQDSESGEESDKDYLELEKDMVYSNQPRHLDIKQSPDSLAKELNSPEALGKLGRIMGYTRTPNIEFIFTNPSLPDPLLPNIIDTDTAQNDTDFGFSKQEAKSHGERIMYSGQPDEDQQIDAVKQIMRSPEKNEEKEDEGKIFEIAVDYADYIHSKNTDNILSYQKQKGVNHGNILSVGSNPISYYLTYKNDLDSLVSDVLENKIKNNSSFEEAHTSFLVAFDNLKEELEFAEEKYGDDHERTLALRSKFLQLTRRYQDQFEVEDFTKSKLLELPIFSEVDTLPLPDKYLGKGGDAKFEEDFNNQCVELLPYEEALGRLPNARHTYLTGVYEGLYPTQEEREAAFFHCERIGSHNFEIHSKWISDVLSAQRWEDVGGSVVMPIPTTIREFLGTQALVSEYESHTNNFRDHIENFIVTRLTKELALMKEDTEDFRDIAVRLDQIREKKRKQTEQKAFVLQRAKQRAIDNGTFTPRKASIVTLALARKGIVEEQDILDQSLELLRRDGKKFTHRDIPASRVDNFNQKFRAIFFNGNLKPMDKARMVATTISNFIVSVDELKIAAGSLRIMSKEPTEFEKQEKEMEKGQGGMAFNLDFASVTVDKKVVKAKLINKKEGEVSWEGYNTSDFEQTETEEEDEIPAGFEGLERFKPHAAVQAEWAKVVDIPLENKYSETAMLEAARGEETEDGSDSNEWADDMSDEDEDL